MLHSGSVARRVFITAVIAISLGGPIVEMLDRWDESAQDGNDTEINVVVAALCAGVAFAIGTILIVSRIRALAAASAARFTAIAMVAHDVASLPVPIPTTSPPAVLRV